MASSPKPDPMQAPEPDGREASQAVPFGEALWFWIKLGFISFGGPAGQIALMHEHLVERRRWISEKRFLHALNYCMVLPGPEAQQLATYLGWLMHRTAGGVLAGLLFVLPSFLLITLIAWAYMAYGHLPAFSGLLDGIKPAVVALVLSAGWRIGSRTLRSARLWLVAVGAFVALHAAGLPFPLVIIAAALVGWVGRRAAAPMPSHGASSNAAVPGPVAARALIDDDTPIPAHARVRPLRMLAIAASGLVLWLLGWVACSVVASDNATLTDMARFF
ncbi:MAG: chromate transporter, partial [Betaproteobacteria bacterium]|nr:chromate transporter [Betaproteobacteria bacterium]